MKNLGKLLLALVAMSQVACTAEVAEKPFDPDAMLKISVEKVRATCMNYTDYDQFPRNIEDGQKLWSTTNVKSWTSGFYPGVLWYAYEYSGDETIKAQAEKFTAPLSEIAYSPAEDHDIGFMVNDSYGLGYRLTGNPEYKEVVLAASETLVTLFDEKVGTIHSWPFNKQYPHNTIIDNMMNLEMLFWAAKNGGDKRLEDIAVRHAEVTQQYIIRPDSATYHVGCFDKESGEFLFGKTHQGYADESMWARGQAWGIYGFAVCYREVGREDFLLTSMRLANRFMERLPEDGVPYWDYDAPNIPNEAKDASASAIAASGMLELSLLVKDEALSKKYYDSAVELLKAISTDEYISGETNDAILLHSTGHHPKNSEIDVPIIYADYYYLEALLKLKKINESK
ncbi:MAG: glycoside hydrolase family 88 protein [Rikenellaceae bacterium]